MEKLEGESGIEVIVTIPFGDEISIAAARGFKAVIVEGTPGRGNQLAAGAGIAKGGVFLFCHADTMLPEGWKELVKKTLAEDSVAGGAFKLRFDSPKFRFRFIAFFANLRGSLLNLVYGDQSFFMKRDVYFAVGGFKPLPLMEDVEFIHRLRVAGKIRIVAKPVVTSARRYEKSGVIFGVAKNLLMLVLYFAGISPEKFVRWYR